MLSDKSFSRSLPDKAFVNTSIRALRSSSALSNSILSSSSEASSKAFIFLYSDISTLNLCARLPKYFQYSLKDMLSTLYSHLFLSSSSKALEYIFFLRSEAAFLKLITALCMLPFCLSESINAETLALYKEAFSAP